MNRDVRGLGTLVPEETLLIPATTDGRVERILIRPGAAVRPNSIILELSNPELQTALLNAEYGLKAAEADYINLRVTLEKQGLDLKASAAQVTADYHAARLKAERDTALAKEGLVPNIDAEISASVSRIARGIEVNERTLSVEVIHRAGPGGNFLKQKDTMSQFRKEHMQPKLADRSTRRQWSNTGSSTARDRARKRVDELLKTHVPEPLAPELRKDADAFIAEFTRDYDLRKLETV